MREALFGRRWTGIGACAMIPPSPGAGAKAKTCA